MSKFRASSSPDLLPSSDLDFRQHDSGLEGVGANVKLLLKLIQDHNDASKEDDNRRPQRIAGMMTILDDVKSRIEKSQVSCKELRRCNTDLRRTPAPKEKKPPQEPSIEENQKLRKELSASMTARKSLEKMFSSLGKEKEIIATELARKVQQLDDMEEHINDLKVQNEMLSEKVKTYAAEQKGKKAMGGDSQGNAALQERNKALSEQLLKSLDGYRAIKRKLKDAQEENSGVHGKMMEIEEELAIGVDRILDLRRRISKGSDIVSIDIDEELSTLEQMFIRFQAKLSKANSPKRMECAKPKCDLVVGKPSILA